ncbi:MAG: PAS domain S-box protein, partial [Terracidiphilus sp.]
MNGQAKKRRGIQASARGPASGVAQERIHPTSQRLRTVLDATTEGYGCWNVSSGEMRFGNRWLAAMGYSSSNLSKNPGFVMSLMHPDDCAGFQAQLETHLAGKTPMLHCELRFRAKTGPYRWFELRAKVVRGATRRGPIELAGTVCDIQARKKKQQEMAASVEQLTAIFQAAEDVVFVVDPGKFRLLSFNKAFEDLLLKARGIKARLGMRPEDITPERAETWNKFYRYVLEHGKASRDYQLHSINMTLHLVAQSLVRNGRAHGICIFGRDMTDRKQMEEALR